VNPLALEVVESSIARVKHLVGDNPMPVYFEADAAPAVGSIVTFSRRAEDTAIVAELQRFHLLNVEPYETKVGETSAILTWRSACTECEASYSFTAGLDTGAFYRRCKKCRRGKKFAGWPKGPRIRHALIEATADSAPTVTGEDSAHDPLTRFNALTSGERIARMRLVKGELGKDAPYEAVAAEVERQLAAEQDSAEVDPASLF
jgi:hypothetical protein